MDKLGKFFASIIVEYSSVKTSKFKKKAIDEHSFYYEFNCVDK
jgi:hypothetical protein